MKNLTYLIVFLSCRLLKNYKRKPKQTEIGKQNAIFQDNCAKELTLSMMKKEA